MNYFLLFSIYIAVFYVIDSSLISSNYDKKEEKNINNKNQKKWEIISNIIMLLLLLIVFIIIMFKVKYASWIFLALLYILQFTVYLINLFEILIYKDEEDLKQFDIQVILLLPLSIIQLYNLTKDANILNININDVNWYLLINVLKNFIYSFFTFMYFFIFIKEMKKFLDRKNIIKSKNKNLKVFKFLDYTYDNCKKKSRNKVYFGVYNRYFYTFKKFDIFSSNNIYILFT